MGRAQLQRLSAGPTPSIRRFSGRQEAIRRRLAACRPEAREEVWPQPAPEMLRSTREATAVREDRCPRCDQPVLLSEDGAFLNCADCISRVPNLECTAAAFAFGDEPDFVSAPLPKGRQVEEWLSNTQAKNAKKVEQSVLDRIMTHIIVEQGVTHSKDITRAHFVEAERALGLQRSFAQYTAQMYSRITGRAPPRFSDLQEHALRALVAAVSSVTPRVHRALGTKRKLPLGQLMPRLVQMLGWQDADGFLMLPRVEGEGAAAQEDFFHLCCAYLGWEYNAPEPSALG